MGHSPVRSNAPRCRLQAGVRVYGHSATAQCILASGAKALKLCLQGWIVAKLAGLTLGFRALTVQGDPGQMGTVSFRLLRKLEAALSELFTSGAEVFVLL